MRERARNIKVGSKGGREMNDQEHPYDAYLRTRESVETWNHHWPNAGEAEKMLRRAIGMVQRADEYGPGDPFDLLGLRLDGWLRTKNSYEFAFRIDKDIPYVVTFFDNAPQHDVWDWKIEHWEV